MRNTSPADKNWRRCALFYKVANNAVNNQRQYRQIDNIVSRKKGTPGGYAPRICLSIPIYPFHSPREIQAERRVAVYHCTRKILNYESFCNVATSIRRRLNGKSHRYMTTLKSISGLICHRVYPPRRRIVLCIGVGADEELDLFEFNGRDIRRILSARHLRKYSGTHALIISASFSRTIVKIYNFYKSCNYKNFMSMGDMKCKVWN